MATTSSTSSTSTTSQLVQALGGGSGVSMTSLAEQLSAAQFANRIDRITARSETLETRISAASSLRGMVQSLATSLGERVRVGDLAASPTIANAAVATATPGAGTPRGTYSLEVTALAKAQALASPPVASATTPVGGGTLTLRFGTIAGTGFTADPAQAAVDVTIAAGSTLGDVAAAINAKGAGVTAYVATGTSGPQLMLKGKEGATNGFILEATGDPGLTALAWTPAGDATRLKSTATDAAFSLDGIERTSTANTIENAAPGLSLKLTATNTGTPTAITFSDPTSTIGSAMQDLTSALNEIAAELNKATAPNGGALANDPGARSLRRAMRELASTVILPNAPAGAPRTLSDLGLATERDGTFRLDSTRLAATLKSDPAGAAAMFTAGLDGVYATVDKISRGLSSMSDAGSLTASISRYSKLKTTLSEQSSDLSEKQETLRQTMVSRFAALDSRLGASKSTLSFLQAQIDAWNGSND